MPKTKTKSAIICYNFNVVFVFILSDISIVAIMRHNAFHQSVFAQTCFNTIHICIINCMGMSMSIVSIGHMNGFLTINTHRNRPRTNIMSRVIISVTALKLLMCRYIDVKVSVLSPRHTFDDDQLHIEYCHLYYLWSVYALKDLELCLCHDKINFLRGFWKMQNSWPIPEHFIQSTHRLETTRKRAPVKEAPYN